jgi:hypothetical protein
MAADDSIARPSAGQRNSRCGMLPSALLVVGLAAGAHNCGSVERDAPNGGNSGDSTGGVVSTAESDAQAGDKTDGADDDVSAVVSDSGSDGTRADAGTTGRYTQGVYTCCAEGEGTDCCVGTAAGTCFRYGGVLGQCVELGGSLNRKDICSLCCEDLKWVPIVDAVPVSEEYPTGCSIAVPPDTFVCLPCGDRVCTEGENRCNCPEDCQ